ncbi:MAG: SUMF1/EgtB/PvdO family nonheme iron enzyme [Anaerolineae bacterium]|nr:SUMF1/EgtB/PvdO family nonheme iron enzyme [Anaerolineae bacterium]
MPDAKPDKQMLGQYELRDLLGQGGMGSVYRAFQANLKREVAVKVLPPHLAVSLGYIERFTREAETAASLEHAHIVPVYDYGATKEASYIVMRLLTGGTLSERAQQHRLAGHETISLSEVADILKQIASALDYAHSRGVIHRDIKPGNIMFDNQGSAYLTDFGIARLMESSTNLTGTGATLGTPLYMSPEQWRGEVITPASDQYAVAVMIYQLITGHTPFEADTPYALMNKHIHEPPTPPQAYRSDIPESVTTVLNRALSKNPLERFPTVTLFAQTFSAAVASSQEESTQFLLFKVSHTQTNAPLPVETPVVAATPPPPRKPFYRSPLVWAAAFVVLLVAGMAALLISQEQRTVALTDSLTQTAIALAPTQANIETNTIESSATGETPVITLTFTGTPAPPTVTETAPPPSSTFSPTHTNTAIVPSVTLIPTTAVPTVNPAVIAQNTQNFIQSATAKQWTHTPTLDATATFNALFEAGLTQTAALWTDTPVPASPTQTPTSSPTLMPPPEAAFSADPALGAAPLLVRFINRSTGNITSYHWDFGDGISSSDRESQHRYTTSGIYSVLLTVSGPGGSSSTQTTVLVSVPTIAPRPTDTPLPLALSVITQNERWTPLYHAFNGLEMVLVPAGCFQLGSSEAEIDAAFAQCEVDLGAGSCQHVWFEKETPQTQICFEHPFWIAYSETTNGQYGSASGQFAETSDNMPRDSVSWFAAAEFCAARGMRLPSEAEWEYAARGPDNLLYPWGDSFDSLSAAYTGNASGTERVGIRLRGLSWVGAVDMAGNLREWTSTIFRAYPYDAADGRESLISTVDDRVVRGGSWYVIPVSLRMADRVNVPPATVDWNIGFRCTRDFQLSDLAGIE